MEINEKTQEPIVLMKKMLIRLLRSTKEKIEAEKKTYEVVFNEIAESAKIDGNYQALLEKSIRLKKEFDEKTDVRTFDLLHKTLLSIENEVEFKELMIEMTPPICDRVLIKNLPFNIETEKIKKVFSNAGKITWLNLRIDEKDESKGICDLRYSHPNEAVQAVAMLNGQIFYDRKLVVRMNRIEKNDEQSGGGRIIEERDPNSTSTNPNSWETLRNRIRQIGDLKFIDKISKIPF